MSDCIQLFFKSKIPFKDQIVDFKYHFPLKEDAFEKQLISGTHQNICKMIQTCFCARKQGNNQTLKSLHQKYAGTKGFCWQSWSNLSKKEWHQWLTSLYKNSVLYNDSQGRTSHHRSLLGYQLLISKLIEEKNQDFTFPERAVFQFIK